MDEKNKTMNDWIQSRVKARTIRMNDTPRVDPVQALHAEVRELRRDLARANGELMPDDLEAPMTLNDFIRSASSRGRAER